MRLVMVKFFGKGLLAHAVSLWVDIYKINVGPAETGAVGTGHKADWASPEDIPGAKV